MRLGTRGSALCAGVLAATLGACGAGDESGSGGACTPMDEGTWSLNGSCFGMEMIGEVTHGADACSFTFSNWSMMMDMPAGGTIAGTTVTLTGDHWTTCTGTTDGASTSGSCSNNECVFDMVWVES